MPFWPLKISLYVSFDLQHEKLLITTGQQTIRVMRTNFEVTTRTEGNASELSVHVKDVEIPIANTPQEAKLDMNAKRHLHCKIHPLLSPQYLSQVIR